MRDRQQRAARHSPFIMQHVSDHGTTNPIVARSALQATDLYQVTTFDEETRKKLGEVHITLMHQLLACFDIVRGIEERKLAALQKSIAERMAGVNNIPYIMKLEDDAETFLFKSKQYIRDCIKLLNMIFGENFKVEAAFFWSGKKPENSAILWSEKRFGNGSDIHQFFSQATDWIAELVKKRNAIEHPGEQSGRLDIKNFRLENGGVAAPVWVRTNAANVVTSSIIPDMNNYIEQLLDFQEQISLFAIRLFPAAAVIDYREIPPEERNPENPARFVMTLKTCLREKFCQRQHYD